MGLTEFLVISAGLIVGWAVVSRIISAYTRKSTDFAAAEWFEILDVRSDAPPTRIDAAYDQKCRELQERKPLIMTLSEKETATQNQADLDFAYRLGKQQGSISEKANGP